MGIKSTLRDEYSNREGKEEEEEEAEAEEKKIKCFLISCLHSPYFVSVRFAACECTSIGMISTGR